MLIRLRSIPVLVILILCLPSNGYLRSQTTRKPAPPAGTIKVNHKDGLKYVWIPPGTFQMGCSPGDNDCLDDEKPLHQVTISKGFWLGQTEVTVGAYKRFARKTGKAMPTAPSFNREWSNDAMPIVSADWNEAQAYCKWEGGRLPTEAEWEYAARAGSTVARYGPLDDIAWYANNGGATTHPEGQKQPNAFGLFDTLGNVWEWVNDWWDENYYQNSPSQDPPGPSSGRIRVLRGGSFTGIPDVRASKRAKNPPGFKSGDYGFRCVKG